MVAEDRLKIVCFLTVKNEIVFVPCVKQNSSDISQPHANSKRPKNKLQLSRMNCKVIFHAINDFRLVSLGGRKSDFESRE